MAEEFDMPIDGENADDRSPESQPRRKAVVKKRAVKRVVATRRRAIQEFDQPEEEPSFFSHSRPRISIDAATHTPHKVNLYRRLALTFMSATVIVVLIIAFFTFQRATVTIAQDAIPVAAAFAAEISENPASSGAFNGVVVTVTTSTESTFKPTTVTDKPGKAHGTVIVHNDGSAPQPLVATTRFLSDGGVLFRLSRAVTVPARSTASAEVVADKQGKEGDIGPTKFTIPGLNPAQQKIVFGESKQAMTGGSSKAGVVSQGDIDKAQEEARKALLEIGQRELTSINVPQGHGVLYTTVNIKAVSSAKPGDEVGDFKIVSSGTMAYVAYPKSAVFAAADREVQSKTPTPYHTVVFLSDAPVVSLQSINVEKKTATLQIYREGRAVLDARSAAFQPAMFMGQTRQQISDQIKSIKGVASVAVKFFPPWIEHAPKVPTRIEVKILPVK